MSAALTCAAFRKTAEVLRTAAAEMERLSEEESIDTKALRELIVIALVSLLLQAEEAVYAAAMERAKQTVLEGLGS